MFYKYRIKKNFKINIILTAIALLLVLLISSNLNDVEINMNKEENALINNSENYNNKDVAENIPKDSLFGISSFKFSVEVPDTWTVKKLHEGCRLESKNDPTQSINLQVGYNSKGLKPLYFADKLIKDIENGDTDGKVMRFKYIYERDGEVFVDTTVNDAPATFGYRIINNHIFVTTVTGEDRDEIIKILSTVKLR